MNIEIIARHGRHSRRTEDYAREKVLKLDRYLRKIAKVEVVLDHDADQHHVEMRLHADLKGNSDVVAHSKHEDPLAAIDLLMAKMERQLVRLKERRETRHSGGGIRGTHRRELPVEDDDNDDLTYEEIIDKEFKR